MIVTPALSRRARIVARALVAVVLLAAHAAAQDAYRQPPSVIQRILDAPATPTTPKATEPAAPAQ